MFQGELPPNLSTSRLRLRPFELADADAVFAYSSKADFGRYIPVSAPYRRDDAEHYVASLRLADWSTDCTWALTLAPDPDPDPGAGASPPAIGSVRLSLDAPHRKADLGYTLDPDLWGQGLAREAVRAAIDAAFEGLPQLGRIECHADARNAASRRLAESLGMRFEGRLRRFVVIRSRAIDVDWFGILRDEWAGERP